MICDKIPPKAAGGGYHVYGLSQKLRARGHDVTIINRGSLKKPYIQELANGTNIIQVRFLRTFPFHLQTHGFFITQTLRNIEKDFDVIHMHNSNIPLIKTAKPKVITVHGTMIGHIANRKVLDLQSLLVKAFSRMYISIDRENIKNSNKVIAISNSCAKELETFYGVKNSEIIPNAVDTTFFSPINKKNISSPYLLYTGRLSPEKGLFDLVEAAKVVCQKFPDLKFVITGKGPIEGLLKRRISQLNLDKNFSFVGYVDRLTLLRYYQNALLYVLPSYWEGLPTTLLEAMSCELPVVGTNVAGTSEVIDNYATGLLVPPNRPKKLEKAIIELLDNSTLRRYLGKNARLHVKRLYDWDVITSKIEQVYKHLIAF